MKMNMALRILNIIGIVSLIIVLFILEARIQDTIATRPVVIQIDSLPWNVTASDGTRIYITEIKK